MDHHKSIDSFCFSILYLENFSSKDGSYKKGESQPTLDALHKLAVVLNVLGDVLLFDDKENQPLEKFLLQFPALNQLSVEDQKSIRIPAGLLEQRL